MQFDARDLEERSGSKLRRGSEKQGKNKARDLGKGARMQFDARNLEEEAEAN